MKCEIIKDLLPSYIEGLTSEISNEEIENHIESCQDCELVYKDMTGEIKEKVMLPTTSDVKEIDFLKTVRKKNIRSIIMTAGIVIASILILISLVAVSFSVSSEDVVMTSQITGNNFEINLKLNNGHDLICFGEPQFVYDDDNKVIGIEAHYRLAWVFNNPFDDVTSSYTIGTEIPSQESEDGYINRTIIEYGDKTVIFENGELVE